jgi:hypothetical protein
MILDNTQSSYAKKGQDFNKKISVNNVVIQCIILNRYAYSFSPLRKWRQ